MSESSEDLTALVRLPEGPERTAALAAWFQGLFEKVEAPPPVLVGGAAVELYSGGAYTSGDLDFVGDLPDAVAELLRGAGFHRKGRHWVHRQEEIFIELPASTLGRGENAVSLQSGGREVLVIDLEALVVDRLAAWEFWKSSVDGVAALNLMRMQAQNVDHERLQQLAEARELARALDRAESFLAKNPEASEQEMATWASRNV